jgi:hypothetical protein
LVAHEEPELKLGFEFGLELELGFFLFFCFVANNVKLLLVPRVIQQCKKNPTITS